MNVLITAVSGPTAIGIIKCLNGQKNINLYGTDIYINSVGKKWLKKVFNVPKNDMVEEYEKKLKEIIKEQSIDIIFPTMQEELELVQKIAEDMNIASATIKGYQMSRLLDKQFIYDDLIKFGLGCYIPRYSIFANENELSALLKEDFSNNKFVCVKQASGHGGKGFRILSLNRKEYIDNLEKGYIYSNDYIESYANDKLNNKMLLSDYIDGDEVSVDLLRHDNDFVSVVSRVRNRVSTGIVIDGQTKKIDKIIEAAKKIADAFNLEGFCNMQFIYNEYYIILIDLNPRFCGSQVMSFGASVNFPKLICDIYSGKKVEKVEPKWNIQTRRYWESVFYDENDSII